MNYKDVDYQAPDRRKWVKDQQEGMDWETPTRLFRFALGCAIALILFIGWCVWPGDVEASMLDGWKPVHLLADDEGEVQ